MKKFIALFCIIFSWQVHADIDLCHDEDYWIEEINKSRGLSYLSQNLRTCFFLGAADTPIGQFDPKGSDIKRSMIAAAKALESRKVKPTYIDVDFLSQDSNLQDLKIRYILKALLSNTSATKLELDRLNSSAVGLLSDLIKMNKTALILHCKYNSFYDKDIDILSKALEQNYTLKELNMKGSKFSMSSRRKLRAAWQANKVEGRKEEIEF